MSFSDEILCIQVTRGYILSAWFLYPPMIKNDSGTALFYVYTKTLPLFKHDTTGYLAFTINNKRIECNANYRLIFSPLNFVHLYCCCMVLRSVLRRKIVRTVVQKGKIHKTVCGASVQELLILVVLIRTIVGNNYAVRALPLVRYRDATDWI